MKKNLHSFVLSVVLILSSFSIIADDKATAEEYVSKSLLTLENFSNDPNMGWFRENIRAAKGILIIPAKLEAAFVLGGSGGTGVLLKHKNDGQWSYPAFYGAGSASLGFQIGVQTVEVVMLVMSEKGMDALLSTKAQLGADMSVAIGPIGGGAAVATTDVLQFSRNKGVFGGVAADGTIISPYNTLNNAYYGQGISAVDILVRGKGVNPQADALRTRLDGFSEIGVGFAFNSANINLNAQLTLDSVVKTLNLHANMTMGIEGYTDDIGSAEFNQELGKDRALSVKGYLISEGIEPARLTVKSFGFANPLWSNRTASVFTLDSSVNLKITNR